MHEVNIENIYAVATGPEDDPQFVYVGKTVSALPRYWEYVHRKNCLNGIEKELYEHIRFSGGIDAYRIVFLDTTENGLTEADYIRTLTEAGYKLLNANKGNRKPAKKRDGAKEREQMIALRGF